MATETKKCVIPAGKRVSSAMDGKHSIAIYGAWIPATSKDGRSAEEDMKSSPPIHVGMTLSLV